MNNYFNEYLEAKLCLYKMVGQFLKYYLPIISAERYGINYSKDEISLYNSIKVVFHDFKEDGIRAWELLKIEKPIIKYSELWSKEKNLKLEKEDKNINYYEEYLKICILIIDMTTNYYIKKYELNCAQNLEIDYDKEIDIYDDVMFVCHHEFENTGEQVWKLFEIENDIVGESVFLEKRRKLSRKLLDLEHEKIKKIGIKK